MVCCCDVLPDPLQQSPGQKEVEKEEEEEEEEDTFTGQRENTSTATVWTQHVNTQTLWLTHGLHNTTQNDFMNIRLMDARRKRRNRLDFLHMMEL